MKNTQKQLEKQLEKQIMENWFEIKLPNQAKQDREIAKIRAKAKANAEKIMSEEGVELHEWHKQYIVRTKHFSKDGNIEAYMIDIFSNGCLKIFNAINKELTQYDGNSWTDYSNQWWTGDRVESIRKIKYLLGLVGMSKSEQNTYLENMVM